MISYLEKFNSLPKDIKDNVSNERTVAFVNELNSRFNINLSTTIIKVVVGEIYLTDLISYLVKNFNLSKSSAEEIFTALNNEVFKKIFFKEKKKTLLPVIEGKMDLAKINKEDDIIVFNHETKLEKKIEKINDNLNFDYDLRVEEIIKKTNLNFSSDIIRERLKKVLLTYLKGIRDKIAVKDYLTKSHESGGLNFDQESAENILLLATNSQDLKKASIKEPPKIIIPEDKQASVIKKDIGLSSARDIEYSFENLKNKKEDFKKIIDNKDKVINEPSKIPAQEVIIDTIDNSQRIPENIPLKSKPSAIFEQDITEFRPKQIVNYEKTKNGKIKMNDIRVKDRVFDPIDELRFMFLKNFRYLDKDPVGAAQKIKNKIDSLAKEGYDKKVDAINAWKISPVNKLYSSVVSYGLENNKSLKEALAIKQKEDRNFLTQEEFYAIMDLNRMLKE